MVTDARARVKAAADARLKIGAQVPFWSVAGAAYGPNVIRVASPSVVDVAANPYAIPVCTGIQITPNVIA